MMKFNNKGKRNKVIEVALLSLLFLNTYFTLFPSASIVDFKHAFDCWLFQH